MPFQESAESWRAKLHLGGARLPVAAGLLAAAIVVALTAGGALLGAASSEGFAFRPAAEGIDAEGGGTEDPAEEKVVVVHVGGAVAAPGVYELPEGSRVRDALAAAGGLASDAAEDALNQARVASDGEQIIVPTVEESLAAAPSAGAAPSAAGKVNINRAGEAELDALPGIGAATARKIIADREENGPFSSPEDLKRVAGIGDKKYEDLADLISVG